MDAMILAAGLGTRLGTVTETTPKALVDVGGVTMLERTARRLMDAGADRLVINLHHFADQITDHLRARADFGVEVCLSPEAPAPLETGGGLLHARHCFRGDGPFYLHNADIITDIDLKAMYDAHVRNGALATLAVHDRASSRNFLFDDDGLFGRSHGDTVLEARTARGRTVRKAFAGVHVISPDIFDLITERGKFSILDPYLRLAGSGHSIQPFDVTGALWLEVGTPERLEEARRRMRDG